MKESAIPVLYYDLNTNVFFARMGQTTLAGMSPDSPFYDPSLASVSSPYLDEIANVMDPASASFDPNADLFMTITPDVDYGATTDDFDLFGDVGAIDIHFASSGVPEPSSLSLIVTGLAVLVGVRLRSRRWRGAISS
jgi:hypothetical protein